MVISLQSEIGGVVHNETGEPDIFEVKQNQPLHAVYKNKNVYVDMYIYIVNISFLLINKIYLNSW